MKRALAFTLMVLAIMIIAVSCEEPQVHVHTYSEKWECDDTYHWHKATCEDTDEVDGKEAHKFGNLIPDVAPTESTTGKGHRVCSVCGYERKEEISALGHSHKLSSGYSKDATGHWQKCSGCNSKVNYSAHTISCVSADDLEHDYKCSVCGYVEKTETHSLVQIEDLTTGEKEQSCKKCSYKKSLAAVATITEKVTSVTKADTSASGVTNITIIDDKGNVSTKEVNNSQIVKNSDTVTISAEVVATADTSSSSSTTTETTKKTSVSFPEGALKMQEGATEVKLTVTALTAEEATSSDSGYQNKTTDDGSDTTSSIKVSAAEAVVAGFEFKLSGAVASDLKGTNKDTEITTYVAKGLNGTNDSAIYTASGETGTTVLNDLIKIQYIGTESGDAKITRYENGTGKLTFTVSHFSKYAIIAKDIVATDSAGRMYTTLDGAISGVKDGGKITLLKNTSWNDSSSIKIDKKISLNLNNTKLTLTFNINNFVWTQETNDTIKAAAFDITSKFTVYNGTVEANGGSTFIVRTNGDLTLENVVVNTKGHYVADKKVVPALIYLYQGSNPATATIKDSALTMDGYYGIATVAIAGKDPAMMYIDIEDSSVTTKYTKDDGSNYTSKNTALLVDVPCKVIIKNSVFKGGRHGAVLRGSNFTVDSSTFESTDLFKLAEDSYAKTDWGVGVTAPVAALVIGNRNEKYKYGTNASLKDVVLKYNNGAGSIAYDLYVYQNNEDCPVIVEGNVNTSWKVNQNMNGASYFVSTWDVKTVDTSWYNKDRSAESYTLTTASQLAGLAELVNNTGNAVTFSGKTINLANDINLNQIEWTPIGLYKDENGTKVEKPFSGTFNGNGHTISGLKIDLETGKEEYHSSYRALFGYVTGTVQNLTVKGEITACDSSGVVAALGDGGKLDNVINYVNVSVTNEVEDEKDHYQAKVAGLVVAVKSGNQGCKITNCKNYGTITSEAKTANDAVGGILAWSNVKKLTVENCVNYGNVKAGSNQVAGGIIGAVWTLTGDGDASYSITKCTNDSGAEISGGTSHNAIIGTNKSNLNLPTTN